MTLIVSSSYLFPMRRDKQGSFGDYGGSMGGGGSSLGIAGAATIAATSISASYAAFATSASYAIYLNGHLGNWYAPIASPTFTGIVTAPDIVVNNTIGSPTFLSGFAGNGWKITTSGSDTTLTVDNLFVRKALTAYELDINKINSVNGGMMISCANGTVQTATNYGSYYYLLFDDDNGNKPYQFVIGDFVRAQIWTGRSIGSYVGYIWGVSADGVYANTISGAPWAGMELVQVGNDTIVTRQNLIYLTSADANNPYIDVLTGVNTASFTGKQVLRLGNLTGITDTTFGALSGSGLWSNNIYLTGGINAVKGMIGGFTVNSTDGLYAGSGSSRIQMKSGSGFWAGADVQANAPFSVTTAGIMTAVDSNIYGNIVYKYTIGDAPLLQNNAEVSTTSTTYVTKKIITLGANVSNFRTIRIYFEIKSSNGNPVYGQIGRLGSAYGTEHMTMSLVYVGYSQDLQYCYGDDIDIFLHGTAGNTCYLQNFQVRGTNSTAVVEMSGTNTM